jgi:hypothetical protein
MLSIVSLLAAASLVAAQTTDPATPPSTDADIAKARASLPECQGLCKLLECRGKPAAEATTCKSDCEAKATACKAAVEKFVKDRIQANADAFKARLATIRGDNDVSKITTVDEAKAKCNTLCTNNVENAEKQTACKAVCDSITDVRTGLKAAADLLQAAARAKFEELQASNPEAADKLKAAADKLRDSVAIQRSFLGAERAKVADALDARVAAIQNARAARQAAVQKAKDEIAAFKAKLDAATTDEEKAAIKADAKAQLETAVAAAKAAQKEARGHDRKALIQKVIDAKKERKANRRVILVDFKKLLGEVADLKKAAKEVDPAAEVDTTPTPATKKRAASAFLIATCEKDDDACLAALNNVVSGFVATEADVTMTETSDAELNEADVENPDAPVVVAPTNAATTNAAATVANKDKTNSASSLLLGFAGVVVAVASMF